MLKRLLYIILGASLAIGSVAFAAPPTQYFTNVAPFQDNTYDLGTTSPLNTWKHIYTQNASTTAFIISGINGSTQCLHINSTGSVSGTGSDCAAATFPFTPATNFAQNTNSTTTPVWFQGNFAAGIASLMASSTSYLSTTTVYTQADDGFKVISSATNHIALFQNTTAGAAHASFCNTVTGCTTADGSDYGIDPSGNTRIIDRENSGFRLLLNATNEVFDINSTENVGISTTTPYAKLSIHANANDAQINQVLFDVASSTASATSTLFQISNIGTASTTKFVDSELGSSGTFCVQASGGGSLSISGVGCGTTSNSHTHDATLNGTSFNGSAAVSDWGINLGNANTWTATQTFNNLKIGTTSAASMLAGFNPDSGIVPTSTPTARSYLATSTVATSTFLGNFTVGTSTNFISEANSFVGNIAASSTIASYEAQEATSTSQTIDFGDSNQSLLPIGTSAITITFVNYGKPGLAKRILVCNPHAGTPGALTWPNGSILIWTGNTNTAPTASSANDICDVYSFITTLATSSPIGGGGTTKVFGAQTANF